MAHIQQRTLADKSRRYDVIYTGPDRRERSRTFTKKALASAFVSDVEAQMARGEWIDPEGGKVHLAEYAAKWLDSRRLDVTPATVNSYRTVIDKWLVPRWGTWPINRIGHEDVAAWLVSIADPAKGGRSVSWARTVRAVFDMVMAQAVRTNRIRTNPVEGARLPLPPKSSRRSTGAGSHVYLTHEQVAALVRHAGSRGLEVLLLAYSGLRWSELAGLRACDVDLLHGTLRIRHALKIVQGKVVHGPPKGNKARTVPFLASAAAGLRARLPVEPTSACGCEVVTEAPSLLPVCHAGEGPVFARAFNRGGEAHRLWMRKTNLLGVLAKACTAAGLPRLTPHDLRHTCASLAVAEGGTVLAVQQLLGHASATITLDTYADLFPDDLSELMGRLDAGARRAAERSRPDRPALGAV